MIYNKGYKKPKTLTLYIQNKVRYHCLNLADKKERNSINLFRFVDKYC